MSESYNKFKKLWDFFEGHIRCINLISRKDRYKSSRKVFDKYNIPVRYFKTEKHPKGGKYGCFDSHIKIIREAYYSGAKRVLIFEDDITTSDHLTIKNLRNAINFMKNQKWDLFYLGAVPNIKRFSSSRTHFKNIYKINGICTHAYVINRSAMKKLLDIKYEGTPIDYYYIKNFTKTYAIYPTLFYQGLSSSDISDYNWWETYSNKKVVKTFYRCVECYAYYINYPLYMLVPLLIIIGAWFLCGMNYRYHILCLVSLVLSLMFLALYTWD